MSNAEVVCDTPLSNVTRSFISEGTKEFEFTKNEVILHYIIEDKHVFVFEGDQVDAVFDDGKYLIPFTVLSRTHTKLGTNLELITTTQKCVGWLIKRYNISFEDSEE